MRPCKYNRKNSCLLNRFDELTMGRCVSCIGRETDRITGLGDLVALTINLTPLRRLKPVVDRVSPKGCGCKKRQKRLNELVTVTKSKGYFWKDEKTKTCGCVSKKDDLPDGD